MEVKNLKAYLANKGITLKDFCESLDCDDGHLSKIMHGHKTASHRLAKDVREATEGLIELKTRVRKKDLKKMQKSKQERT